MSLTCEIESVAVPVAVAVDLDPPPDEPPALDAELPAQTVACPTDME